jgi:hypothetical protein
LTGRRPSATLAAEGSPRDGLTRRHQHTEDRQ